MKLSSAILVHVIHSYEVYIKFYFPGLFIGSVDENGINVCTQHFHLTFSSSSVKFFLSMEVDSDAQITFIASNIQ